jgi:hypothetical protein
LQAAASAAARSERCSVASRAAERERSAFTPLRVLFVARAPHRLRRK